MEPSRIKSPVTWVVVCDAKTAQIFLPEMVEHRVPLASNSKRKPTAQTYTLDFVPILAKPLVAESLEEFNLGRNKTGMVFESFSSSRHMAEPHLDAHKEIRQHFAQRIANFLSTAKMGEAFNRLILVAPPEMLGEINSKLNDNVRSKLLAKVDKELTHCSRDELASHLAEYL